MVWHFERCNAAIKELPQLFGIQRTAFLRKNRNCYFFTKTFMRHTKYCNFVHSVIFINGAFYFNAINVFATTKDHVFNAVLDEQESFIVDVSTIASAQPTVNDCFCSGIRAIPISTNKHRSKHADLAHLIWPKRLKCFWVTNFNAHWCCCTACTCWSSCVELASVARAIRIGFGHAVSKLWASLFHGLINFVYKCCWRWCTAAANCAQAAGVVLVKVGVVHKVE